MLFCLYNLVPSAVEHQRIEDKVLNFFDLIQETKGTA